MWTVEKAGRRGSDPLKAFELPERISFPFIFVCNFVSPFFFFFCLVHIHQCPWPVWGQTIHVGLRTSYT